MTFTTLILSNIGLILTNRSWNINVFSILKEKNTAFIWIVIGALTFLSIALFVLQVIELFKFSTLHTNDLLMCFAAAFVSAAITEIIKLISRLYALNGVQYERN